MTKPWRVWTPVVVLAMVIWVTILYVGKVSTPQPVVLWRDRQSLEDFAETHRLLSGISFDTVNWTDAAFEEALSQLESWVHESNPDAQKIHFQIDENVPRRTPITLNFREVPANEVLRYLSALNEARFHYLSDGLVEIVPLDAAPPPMEEGWFSLDFAFFHEIDHTDPEAARNFFLSAGISLHSSDQIEFFPDRGLLKVSSAPENLDLIDAYLWAACRGLEPTWRDRFDEWWYQTKVRLRLVIPPSPPLRPDPFGGSGTTLPGAPPDPFGD